MYLRWWCSLLQSHLWHLEHRSKPRIPWLHCPLHPWHLDRLLYPQVQSHLWLLEHRSNQLIPWLRCPLHPWHLDCQLYHGSSRTCGTGHSCRSCGTTNSRGTGCPSSSLGPSGPLLALGAVGCQLEASDSTLKHCHCRVLCWQPNYLAIPPRLVKLLYCLCLRLIELILAYYY